MSKIIQKKAAEQALTNQVKQQEIIAEVTAAAVQTRKRKADSEVTKQAAPKSKKGSKVVQTLDSSSVVYLGHLPHGFYEPQLKKFFMQFGIVRKLKLFRSPKTGGSRGFAFLQFESPATAQTVSDAMHGYFLHDRQLVSHVVPAAKHHEGMWKMKKPTDEMVAEAAKDVEPVEKTVDSKKAHEALLKRMAEKQNKLDLLGIDFQIPPLSC